MHACQFCSQRLPKEERFGGIKTITELKIWWATRSSLCGSSYLLSVSFMFRKYSFWTFSNYLNANRRLHRATKDALLQIFPQQQQEIKLIKAWKTTAKTVNDQCTYTGWIKQDRDQSKKIKMELKSTAKADQTTWKGLRYTISRLANTSLHQVYYEKTRIYRIYSNYSSKWRWLVVVDIYRRHRHWGEWLF